MADRVGEIMTPHPLGVRALTLVRDAEAIAAAHEVHHLPVIDIYGDLTGIVCRCDLREAEESAIVAACASSPVITVSMDIPISVAADLMRQHGVGSLPVISSGGYLLGIVTRRDLRRAGVLGRERGVDACAACGSTHALSRREHPEDVLFCAVCIGGDQRRMGQLDSIDTGGEA